MPAEHRFYVPISAKKYIDLLSQAAPAQPAGSSDIVRLYATTDALYVLNDSSATARKLILDNDFASYMPYAGNLITIAYTANLKITSNQLDTVQPIQTTSSPTFKYLTLTDTQATTSGLTITQTVSAGNVQAQAIYVISEAIIVPNIEFRKEWDSAIEPNWLKLSKKRGATTYASNADLINRITLSGLSTTTESGIDMRTVATENHDATSAGTTLYIYQTKNDESAFVDGNVRFFIDGVDGKVGINSPLGTPTSFKFPSTRGTEDQILIMSSVAGELEWTSYTAGTNYWTQTGGYLTPTTATDDILIQDDEELRFRDVATYIKSSLANHLDINAPNLNIYFTGQTQFAHTNGVIYFDGNSFNVASTTATPTSQYTYINSIGNGTVISSVESRGYVGSLHLSSYISHIATETWTDSVKYGTSIHIGTVSNGTTAYLDRLVIDGLGNTNIWNGDLIINAVSATATKSLKLNDLDNSAYVGLKSADTATTYTITLPAAAPGVNSIMQVTSAGVGTWIAVPSTSLWADAGTALYTIGAKDVLIDTSTRIYFYDLDSTDGGYANIYSPSRGRLDIESFSTLGLTASMYLKSEFLISSVLTAATSTFEILFSQPTPDSHYVFDKTALFANTGTLDIGKSDKLWKDLYLDGNVYFDDTNHKIYNNSGVLTSSSTGGNTLIGTTIIFANATPATLTINFSGATFYPSPVISLGTSSHKWDGAYLDYSGLFIYDSDNTNYVNLTTISDVTGSYILRLPATGSSTANQVLAVQSGSSTSDTQLEWQTPSAGSSLWAIFNTYYLKPATSTHYYVTSHAYDATIFPTFELYRAGSGPSEILENTPLGSIYWRGFQTLSTVQDYHIYGEIYVIATGDDPVDGSTMYFKTMVSEVLADRVSINDAGLHIHYTTTTPAAGVSTINVSPTTITNASFWIPDNVSTDKCILQATGASSTTWNTITGALNYAAIAGSPGSILVANSANTWTVLAPSTTDTYLKYTTGNTVHWAGITAGATVTEVEPSVYTTGTLNSGATPSENCDIEATVGSFTIDSLFILCQTASDDLDINISIEIFTEHDSDLYTYDDTAQDIEFAYRLIYREDNILLHNTRVNETGADNDDTVFTVNDADKLAKYDLIYIDNQQNTNNYWYRVSATTATTITVFNKLASDHDNDSDVWQVYERRNLGFFHNKSSDTKLYVRITNNIATNMVFRIYTRLTKIT